MQKPNILVFMSDQQNGRTQPPNGIAQTPNLDRLFDNGVAFSKAYCPSPHCCPSRASFFSGLYPSQHGVWNNVDVPNTLSRGLFDDVQLFSEDLKQSGYQLFLSGKWHVSAEEGPEDRGFMQLYPPVKARQYQKSENRPDMSEWNKYKHLALATQMNNRGDGYIDRPGFPDYVHYGQEENPFHDQDVVDAACAKISDLSHNQPFFMYVGTLGPHDPYIVPQQFLDLYDLDDIELPSSFDDKMLDKPALYRRSRRAFDQLTETEHREAIRHYLAFCSYEDYLFGQLVKRLEQKSLLENTIVIYVSDHGDYMGAHGLWTKGLPCFDEAYHVCSMIGYGPVTAKRKTVDEFVSLTDYAPTILDLAGIEPDNKLPGFSLQPFLHENDIIKQDEWRQEIYTQSNGNEQYGIQRSVFDRHYKLVYNGFDEDEFYDLKNDPDQMVNLAGKAEYRDIIYQYYQKLWKFAYEHEDVIVNPYIMTALAEYGPGIAFE